MLVYLLNSRKLPDLTFQTLFFRGALRFLFLLTLLNVLGVKKHTLFNKFLSQKKDSQFDRKKEMLTMREERERFF